MRILIVEDEKKIANLIAGSLRAQGIDCDLVGDGAQALKQIKNIFYNVVVLDLMLPSVDGMQILRQLRETGLEVPVLILSAKGTTPERIQGLNQGADDYLAKPFVMEELLARIQALSRRKSADRMKLQCGDLLLDISTRAVTRAGRSIDLTPREFALLEFLLRAEGRAVGRMAILQGAWNYSFDPGTNVVDVYIGRLRRKVDDEFEQKLLQTEPYLGYVMRSGK